MIASAEDIPEGSIGGISGRLTKAQKHKVSIVASPSCNLETPNTRTICDRSKLCGMFTNARSLADKMGELEILLYKEDLDFVGISETWFNSSHDWLATIQGYSLYRRDREGKKQ